MCASVEWVHVCLGGVGACVLRWSGCTVFCKLVVIMSEIVR